MSKIAICSIIIGAVGVTTRQGEVTKVVFEDKGGIGYAEVSHEQAEQLLKIKGEYWKPGERNINDAVQTALNADPAAQKAAADLLNGNGADDKKDNDGGEEKTFKNVAQMVELIKLAATIEEVEELVAGDERTGVQTAAAKRKEQLTKAE